MLFDIIAEPEVVEFLMGLSPADRAKADQRAGLLAEEGATLGEPYSKYLGDGVRELRFSLVTSNTNIRITYWFPGGRTIILLTVFTKVRQRDIRQVERAKQARKVCETEHTPDYHNIFELEKGGRFP